MRTFGLRHVLVAGLLALGCAALRSSGADAPTREASLGPTVAAAEGTEAAEGNRPTDDGGAPSPTPSVAPDTAEPSAVAQDSSRDAAADRAPSSPPVVADGPGDPWDWDELELTPLPRQRGCARVEPDEEAEVSAAQERVVCHRAGARGDEIDEMTTEQPGALEVRDAKAVLHTLDYDRVRTEGAAGSLYETYYLGTTPRFVLHRCFADRRPTKRDDGYDLCGVRLPPALAPTAAPKKD